MKLGGGLTLTAGSGGFKVDGGASLGEGSSGGFKVGGGFKLGADLSLGKKTGDSVGSGVGDTNPGVKLVSSEISSRGSKSKGSVAAVGSGHLATTAAAESVKQLETKDVSATQGSVTFGQVSTIARSNTSSLGILATDSGSVASGVEMQLRLGMHPPTPAPSPEISCIVLSTTASSQFGHSPAPPVLPAMSFSHGPRTTSSLVGATASSVPGLNTPAALFGVGPGESESAADVSQIPSSSSGNLFGVMPLLSSTGAVGSQASSKVLSSKPIKFAASTSSTQNKAAFQYNAPTTSTSTGIAFAFSKQSTSFGAPELKSGTQKGPGLSIGGVQGSELTQGSGLKLGDSQGSGLTVGGPGFTAVTQGSGLTVGGPQGSGFTVGGAQGSGLLIGSQGSGMTLGASGFTVGGAQLGLTLGSGLAVGSGLTLGSTQGSGLTLGGIQGSGLKLGAPEVKPQEQTLKLGAPALKFGGGAPFGFGQKGEE